MSASDAAARPLGSFPVVFLSYDEPWADRNWLDLKSIFPQAVRVHGVKGLDACHKAAAAAVPGDWVVTVDADTRVSPALACAPVPSHLLTGNFRLDWLARNAVNGLWSGNGCVKLWPKALIEEMRTHEAAPPGALSLDHDIAAIRNGRSVQVAMPERAATTDPAATAFHAFRAGLRETTFLRNLAEQAAARRGEAGWQQETELLRLIEVWCSIGRQAINGAWMLYGARLGVLLPDLWPDWDPRQVNDHDSLHRLWAGRIAPSFQRGKPLGTGEPSWNWPALEAGLCGLAREIALRGGPEIVEFDAPTSGLLAGMDRLASPIRPARLDALGYLLLKAAATPDASTAACRLLDQAAVLDHPAAHFNLAMLRDRQGASDPERAAWHLGAAAALGNPAARQRIEAEEAAGRKLPTVATAADLPRIMAKAAKPAKKAADTRPCLVLDPGVTLLAQAERHVPDGSLIAEGAVLGYLSICPITSLPRPRGIRLMRAADLRPGAVSGPPAAVYPVVLGQLPTPADAGSALREAWADGSSDVPLVFLTLGRDASFGDQWVLGSLMARLERRMSDREIRKWAGAKDADLAAEIARLASDLARQSGSPVPVWTAAESRALKRMIPRVPPRLAWLAAGEALARLGPIGTKRATVLRELAQTLWGAETASV